MRREWLQNGSNLVAAAATLLIAAGCSTGPRDPGSLIITVSSPPIVPAAITVSGPSGFHAIVTATTTLPGLRPGTYTIDAAKVVASGTTYGATPPTMTVAVPSRIVATAFVAYLRILNITSGAPPNGVALVKYGPIFRHRVCRGGGTQCSSRIVFQGFTFRGEGGLPPYSWSATSLPTGLSLDAYTAELTGTPQIAGSYSALVTMTDSAVPQDSTTATYQIVITP